MSNACAEVVSDAARRIRSGRNAYVKCRNRIYGAVTVKVTEMVVVPFSKNCGLTAKNAGTDSPLALLRGTAFMMIGPLSAVVADEKALRFDLTAVNS